MVVVVPTFAKSDQATKRDIIALHARTMDMPFPISLSMGKITDQPMPRDAHGHTHAYTPDYPTDAAYSIEQ